MAQPYVGEIRMFAGNFAPAGWMFCEGQLLPIAEYETLFNLIGTTYGGDGQSTFQLPDLRSRIPIHQGNGFILAETGGGEEITLTVNQIAAHSHPAVANTVGSATSPTDHVWAGSPDLAQYAPVGTLSAMNVAAKGSTGGSQPHTNFMPYLCVDFIISLYGIFPSSSSNQTGDALPFFSEIRMFAFEFAPGGWALCNGQLLPISVNQALFSLLGTTFGGDGRVNFALPDLRGCTPIHVGSGHTLGERGGEQAHTLSTSELPTHTHVVNASSAAASANAPADNLWADGGKSVFADTYTVALAPQAVGNTGGSQAHLNMQPFLTLSFCIALQGIFPSAT
jgi:microcystin-dependent protein